MAWAWRVGVSLERSDSTRYVELVLTSTDLYQSMGDGSDTTGWADGMARRGREVMSGLGSSAGFERGGEQPVWIVDGDVASWPDRSMGCAPRVT